MIVENSEAGAGRDVILHSLDGSLQRISETHSAYDPCQYPLLFPFGSAGWFPSGYKLKTPPGSQIKYASARHFTNYRLQVHFFILKRQIRPPAASSIVHRGGRLLQQYVVDQYAKIQQNELRYLHLL